MTRSCGTSLAAACLMLVVAACGAADSDNIEPADTLQAAAPDTTPAAPQPPVNPVIRSDGIGSARIGMRVADLRRTLPAGLSLGTIAPFMVDIDALPVIQGSDTLYYVLSMSGDTLTDGSTIELLATTHSSFRTGQGVGPGTTLGEAASIYGQPTLSYSVNDESREYARFPALPSSIMVRTAGPGGAAFAGQYESEGEVNETTRYNPAARISMVLVGRY